MAKEFLLHCDFCGRKVVIRDPSGIAGLKEVPLAPIPGGVPAFDPDKKKAVSKKSIPRRRMLKCSQCGRGIVLKPSMIPKEDIKETIVEEEDNSFGREGRPFGPSIS